MQVRIRRRKTGTGRPRYEEIVDFVLGQVARHVFLKEIAFHGVAEEADTVPPVGIDFGGSRRLGNPIVFVCELGDLLRKRKQSARAVTIAGAQIAAARSIASRCNCSRDRCDSEGLMCDCAARSQMLSAWLSTSLW